MHTRFDVRLSACSLLLVLGALISPAMADTAATPEAHAYLEKYGPNFPWDKEQEIIALYTKLLAATRHDDSALNVARNQAYGSDIRQRLDVHYAQSMKSVPVLIFVEGGGFVAGDKNISTAIYDNIGHYFARRGVVGVIMNYRLAPAHQWPAGTEDVKSALQWVRSNVRQYGGNPDRVFLAGHSAGAAHVAGYAFSPRPAEPDGVAGVILLSGVYSADAMFADYYGTDKARRLAAAPMTRLGTSRSLPTLVGFGEYDPIPIQMESAQLAQRLCERDKRCPVVKQAIGHNHMSLVFHIDTADDSLAGDMLSFMQRNSKN